MARLLPRLGLVADGHALSCRPSATPEALLDRSALRLRLACDWYGPAGVLQVRAALFPYDPAHQTFLNVYERGALQSQFILDRDHPAAHSLTLSMAALALMTPPARIVEPAIALSIVYVGIDNLLVKDGRDVRAWIALGFGLVHGFGFASVLREMDLPRRALGWSLFSFNFGVEIGQLLVVLAVAFALALLRARSERAGRRLAVVGSVVVAVAGSFWFVQRVFLS